MKFARRAKHEVEVNLTPLIDVVFLLLIFFMVSTTFTRETHLSIDLPEATGAKVDAQENQIDIAVTQTGEYTVNDQSLVNDDLDTLKIAIRKISDGDTSVPLIITADARAPHQSVVTAMDAAGQLGFVHLSITTRNPVDDE
ncbi:MAG: biopolymer transporter ExbD [Pseudomonadales bacterium]